MNDIVECRRFDCDTMEGGTILDAVETVVFSLFLKLSTLSFAFRFMAMMEPKIWAMLVVPVPERGCPIMDSCKSCKSSVESAKVAFGLNSNGSFLMSKSCWESVYIPMGDVAETLTLLLMMLELMEGRCKFANLGGA